MKDLKKLQEFHFEIPDNRANNCDDDELAGVKDWVYSWCAQNLPRLKLIGNTLYAQDLFRVTPTFSGTSSLETLHSTSFLPEASLPNLKKLRFCGEIKDLNFLPKLSNYKNLTSLVLYVIEAEELEQILKLIGSQLSHLFVSVSNVNISIFYAIFYFCPNLVKFEIEFDLSVDPLPLVSKYKDLVDSNNFLRLEEFKCDCFVPAGFLSLIFLAPLISSINLEYFSLCKEDLVWLQDVVEGRFQKLTSVDFDSVQLAPGCEMKDLGQFVKFLVCGAPNFSSVMVSWDPRCGPEFREYWNSEQTGAVKFMKLLRF